MAGLALALRFVPYSDDHGHFDAVWTAVILACGVAALAASVYLLVALEILKLRASASRQLAAGAARPPAGGGRRRGGARARDGKLPGGRPRDRRVRGDRGGDRRVRGPAKGGLGGPRGGRAGFAR